MTQEQTTGFLAWCERQPQHGSAGKLLLVAREDLARGQMARMPTTVREFEGWLRSYGSAVPSDWVVLLRLAANEWQYWLSVVSQPEPEHAVSPSGRPTDNPFARTGDF